MLITFLVNLTYSFQMAAILVLFFYMLLHSMWVVIETSSLTEFAHMPLIYGYYFFSYSDL